MLGEKFSKPDRILARKLLPEVVKASPWLLLWLTGLANAIVTRLAISACSDDQRIEALNAFSTQICIIAELLQV
jgi:hypothetical protein